MGVMTGKPRLPLLLTEAERQTLQGWASRRRTAQGLAQRARIVLMCADGMANTAVATELGITRETVGKWRNRFVRDRFAGLSDEPRPGVPRSISDAVVEEVVVKTLEEVPEGATHWSKRELAKRVGISPTSVASSRFDRSEEHTSELQSPDHLVCRLLLEKKNVYTQAVRRSDRATASTHEE